MIKRAEVTLEFETSIEKYLTRLFVTLKGEEVLLKGLIRYF